MGYVKWSYDTLNTFCHDVFRKFGFNEEETLSFLPVFIDIFGNHKSQNNKHKWKNTAYVEVAR